MSFYTAYELNDYAAGKGLRRAIVVTAQGLELQAVRGHLTDHRSVLGKDGIIYECGRFMSGGHDWLVVSLETGVVGLAANTRPSLAWAKKAMDALIAAPQPEPRAGAAQSAGHLTRD